MARQHLTIQQLVVEGEAELAHLREQVQHLEGHLAWLREKLPDSGANGAAVSASRKMPQTSPVDEHSVGDLPMPELVLRVLRKEKRPLQIWEITDRLTKLGVTSNAKKGLAPNVSTALKRRGDLFAKKGRGLYALKEWDKANRDTHKAESGA